MQHCFLFELKFMVFLAPNTLFCIGYNAQTMRCVARDRSRNYSNQQDQIMECTVRWVGANAGMSFIGESGSGHAMVMDGAPEAGGRNLGPRPMEMLLMGTGGCSAFDVVLILQRSRQKVSDCQVQLRATRAETDPKVFTQIHFHFIVSGQELSESAVERAVKLSHEKYCSASIMLGQVAQITHSLEIVDTAQSSA